MDIDRISKVLIANAWRYGDVYTPWVFDDLRRFNGRPEVKYCASNILKVIDCANGWGLFNGLSEAEIQEIRMRIPFLLEIREIARYEKIRKIAPKEPLDQLMLSLDISSWASAKRSLAKLAPSGFLIQRNEIVSDERAELIFERICRAAESGTYLQEDFIESTSPFTDVYGQKKLVRMSELIDDALFASGGAYSTIKARSIREGILQNNVLFRAPLDNLISVYRGTSNPHSIIKPGDYVTLDRDYAREYVRGRFGVILSDAFSPDDLIVSKIPFSFSSVELIYLPRLICLCHNNNWCGKFPPKFPGSFRELIEWLKLK